MAKASEMNLPKTQRGEVVMGSRTKKDLILIADIHDLVEGKLRGRLISPALAFQIMTAVFKEILFVTVTPHEDWPPDERRT